MKDTKYTCRGTRIVVSTSTFHFMEVPTISTPFFTTSNRVFEIRAIGRMHELPLIATCVTLRTLRPEDSRAERHASAFHHIFHSKTHVSGRLGMYGCKPPRHAHNWVIEGKQP